MKTGFFIRDLIDLRSRALYWFHSVSSTTASAPSQAAYGFLTNSNSGNIADASSMATGSWTRSLAPFSARAGRMVNEGASRRSSVSGLKVTPKIPMVLPASEPPMASLIFLTILAFWAELTSTAASTSRAATLFSWAIRIRARVSFGKQDPP